MRRVLPLIGALVMTALLLAACGGSDVTTDQPDRFVWDGAGYVGVSQGDKSTDVFTSPDALTWTRTRDWPNAVARFGLCPNGFDCSVAATPDGRVGAVVAGDVALLREPGNGAPWRVDREGQPTPWAPEGIEGSSSVYSSGTSFWATSEDRLMASEDGQVWTPVALNEEWAGPTTVEATGLNGHIAVKVCGVPGEDAELGEICVALFSNDDAATWSDRVELTDSMSIIAVGPGGLLIEDFPLSSERRVNLMDSTGELARTTTIGSDLPLGGVVDATGALVTQRRAGAAPLIWRLES